MNYGFGMKGRGTDRGNPVRARRLWNDPVDSHVAIGHLLEPRFHRRQTGLAMVELAVVGGVLALLLGAVTFYGVRLYQKNTLIKAVQDAGRYYALNCAEYGGGSTLNKAIDIINASLHGLKVTVDKVAIDKTYIQARIAAAGGVSFNVDGSLLISNNCTDACSAHADCQYVEFRLPKSATTFVLGDWTFKDNPQGLNEARPITSVNRIMRP